MKKSEIQKIIKEEIKNLILEDKFLQKNKEALLGLGYKVNEDISVSRILKEDDVVSNSNGKQIRQTLIELGIPEDSIFAIYNNKVPSLINPNRRRFKINIVRFKITTPLAKKIGDTLISKFQALKDSIFISPVEIFFSTN